MTALLCLVADSTSGPCVIRCLGTKTWTVTFGIYHLISTILSNKCQIYDVAAQLSADLEPTLKPSQYLCLEPSHSDGLPPPSYDDTIADLPPDYTATDALAAVQSPEYTPWSSLNASLCSNVPNCLRLSCNTSPTSSLYFDEKSLYADIDFGFSEDGVKSHAKKKKGAAATKKTPGWGDDEDKKEEGAAGDAGGDNGGGDPPADGGAGGAGDGGDGGDEKKGDDDWGSWDTGKKKKGKKGKKDEEEEERKRKEEEEEAERKKKDDEAAAAATTSPGADLSWADQAEDAKPDDDWGAFATVGKTSKKKGKKGKVRNFGCLITRCNALTSR